MNNRQQFRQKQYFHPKLILPVLLIIIFILSIVSLGLGAIYITPSEIIHNLIGEGTQSQRFILNNYRIPRIIIAIIVGAGLATAGAILQGILRNPLASPDVIGVTKGAGLAAVIIIVLFPTSPIIFLPLSAFIGAAIIAAILMLFVYKKGAQPNTLALVGIALGAICQAGIEYLMIKFPDDVSMTLLWLTGSLWARGWDQVYLLLPCLILIPILFGLTAKLDILSLGDDIATGLGERSKFLRYILLSVSVILIGVCVATVGSIGFIGLIAPHIARRIVGSKFNVLLPASALFGAILLLVADSLGRGLFPPIEIPAGIITAVIGAPYFLYLLRAERKKA
ncbi:MULTISPECIES: iron ABC transporter permease [Lysinibacillus]|uniref:Iron ABC transporter permease n=1 Tax=Lysinibacillus fusiformis TaxID=28031 RepID=A0A2I0V3W3_9BACI|nr:MULTISPECIES: iron ABC transporter permease [Lysinibacillus]KUF36750.1 iron-dicitrate transporter subunit FecD [Lysinibacillus sp. F5]MEE3807316.1 iron ABC transporter permease [Lysinibacillus fusiformis]PKU53005.1 iron ABC transporter permease [Lysinibacillus fusiformis]WCH49045.1 iron ABC transporter permease [Lysinibacillus sp. OF-1]SCX95393.1 iron complex transport system permease protein [Lysinibacillus sp. SG9]